MEHILREICDPDGVLWLPEWAKNYNNEELLEPIISCDRQRMIENKMITTDGKLLDKGYQTCTGLGIKVPITEMA